MTDSLERLTASITKESSAVDSAVALIKGLSQQVRDLGTKDNCPPEMVAAANTLADQIDAKTQSLADAVASNTAPPATPAT